jgi:hypothetical protein
VQKLADPRKVFGEGVNQPDGTWETKNVAAEAAVMQFLEHGFVRNDEMPARSPDEIKQNGKKPVFNAEVVTTLARFGWSPGATFGDTMHFDFIEGYTQAVPGGRSAENLNSERFSPEGPPKPAPSKRKRAKP